MKKNYDSLKNIAIVAHVDHGKTTLLDGLLQQSGSFNERDEIVERVMDSGELERERGITITAKNCSILWNNTKINLLDTPGHSDFGGEVERSLMMVDGILLLVDASEGPLPQTRFVLQKAIERNLKVAVVVNKIDRPDQRIDEVKHEVEELFLDLATILDIPDFDLDIPFLYASAKQGWATYNPGKKQDNLHCILDFIAGDFFPKPKIAKGKNLQILVSNLSYSPYLGALVIGRIHSGSIRRLANYTICKENKITKSFKASAIQTFDRLGQVEVEEASAGDIVIVSGIEDAKIGDTICSQDHPIALPRISVEPPTVSVNVSVSTSPLSGQEGEYLTSRRLDEFLDESCRTNVALQYEATDDPKIFQLKGRGELQLAIVFEQLRRKGYEFMVSRPQVLMQYGQNGERLEPFELLVIDIPNDATGVVTEKLSTRKGKMQNMSPLGDSRARIEFSIPSRGIIGYRSVFLTDTKGEGLMSSQFLGYRPYAGDMLSRQNGAIVCDRPGRATPYALFNLLSTGKQFIKPGESVYEGMVMGEHTKKNDCNVNCVRQKHLSSMRTAGKDVNIILPPIANRTLDWAIDWIDQDEWVEVTPQTIRIRKKILKQNHRSVIR
ncbi:MAG: translational GTPase TypA [Bacteriovoracaceae bacterium]|nr:translational GTPase TypA [Bacteriovoracaceae bacterium]